MSPEQSPPTMADVARAVGVSTGTVSRALRGQPGVSDAMRRRILRAAESLDYVVSPAASGLVTGRTGSVAVLVPFISRWFHAQVLAAAHQVLRGSGFEIVLYHVEGTAERREFFETLPVRRRADGLVVIALSLTDEELARLNGLGMPVVGASTDLGPAPAVGIDDVAGAAKAVRHLANLGHRRIAMIRSTDEEGFHGGVSRRRLAGYEDAMTESGLEVDPALVVSAPWGIDGGARAMGELLSQRTPPTAVFAEADEIAIGALRTLRRAGIAVPGEMSVIGFDDSPMAELLDLTTVAQSVHEQGLIAGRMLVEAVQQARVAEPAVRLETRLVPRGTTSARPGRPGTAG
ncbi:LacI family DNA-binding transcriptional regulator [Streptomyces litchfieldiae]|uniref:LacI family DNA-binding transcriptional regulator n=1 Tax=Streptomyces litchfieldiae TaxID=3075543 RepID=A0ABU2MUC8_9ACTN|nr:LacI family DNA-binding transcriptional regulator [Streptomyces sp. DSM 44938]MDT0344438.1 LacI family DNA-binding transcriptional regulator [Streptomyces sp. DSM 44938]